MGENENKSISSKEEQKKQGPLFSIFPDFQIKFPQFPQFNKKEATKEVAVAPLQGGGVGEESKEEKPDIVRVSDGKKEFPSLKLENEEEEASGTQNMWQVYVLGGFLIARWLWGKWKESKANNSDKQQKSGDGDGNEDPTTTDD